MSVKIREITSITHILNTYNFVDKRITLESNLEVGKISLGLERSQKNRVVVRETARSQTNACCQSRSVRSVDMDHTGVLECRGKSRLRAHSSNIRQ
jgi:hypothetical protein